MKFLEKDLETIIWEADPDELFERNLCFYGDKKFRQLRIGNYGIADLVAVNVVNSPYGKHLEIDVFELKQNQIDEQALLQALRYARGIIHYLEHRKSTILARIDITLIGNSIDRNGDYLYFEHIGNDHVSGLPPIDNGIGTITFKTYDYQMDGIQFTEHTGWHLGNHGFRTSKLKS